MGEALVEAVSRALCSWRGDNNFWGQLDPDEVLLNGKPRWTHFAMKAEALVHALAAAGVQVTLNG